MNKFNIFLLLSLLTIFSLISCRNLFRKDMSLTTAQYSGQGMPDLNKSWTERDFQKAQNAINAVLIKDFHSLPREASRKSGDVFKRIISKDNLKFLEDTTLSLRNKAYRIQALGNFMGQLGTLYTDKLKAEQYYSAELTDIFISHLYVRGKMLELAEKIDKSTNQDDIVMQSGRNGITGSYVLLITFLTGEQEKAGAYRSGDLKKLSKEVANSLKENKQYLDTESVNKIAAILRKSIEKAPSSVTSNTYKEILTFLEN